MIKITNPADCCGCTACASICSHDAISMEPDALGFLYPKVNKSKCVECGLCKNICPILEREIVIDQKEPLRWLAARHNDVSTLLESTSGGVFSSLAEYIISNNGIVYGAAYNSKMEVIHTSSETKDGYRKFMGSKYVQSNLSNVFRQIKTHLLSGKIVLFSGTPCQVAGLNSFLRKDYENLLTVDIICHSVPSPKVFSDYIKYAEKVLGGMLADIKMRDKQKKGWSHSTSTRYIFRNGESCIDPDGLIDWNSIYFSGLIHRPSCSECKFCNLNRSGDLTIGDFWDDMRSRPDLYDNKGTSIVLVNTIKGDKILKSINVVSLWVVKKEDALQQNLQHPTIPNEKSEAFRAFYIEHGFESALNKYIIGSKRNLLQRFKIKIKMFFKS